MHADHSSPVRPSPSLPDAERKARARAAALCALNGATFTVTDDDRGAPLFVVAEGAVTHLFRSLGEVDSWLTACSEVVP